MKDIQGVYIAYTMFISVRKTNNRSKQIMQIIKIHRTALRVIQVAASRPILRVLNPHIYSDLVGLIKELLNLSGIKSNL